MLKPDQVEEIFLKTFPQWRQAEKVKSISVRRQEPISDGQLVEDYLITYEFPHIQLRVGRVEGQKKFKLNFFFFCLTFGPVIYEAICFVNDPKYGSEFVPEE